MTNIHRIKPDIADVMIGGGLAIVILWMFGKLVGWISSPLWVDMLPLAGFIIAIAGISVKIGRTLEKIDNMLTAINRLETNAISAENRLTALESLIATILKKIGV